MVEVHISVEKEIHLQGKGERFKKELLELLGQDGQLIMESVTPRGYTHRGANSYRVNNKGSSVEITNDKKYLVFVNEGTGIYGRGSPIVPVRAKFLHFWLHGAKFAGHEMFAKSVRGQPGQHFVERGVNDIVRSIDQCAIIASKKVLG